MKERAAVIFNQVHSIIESSEPKSDSLLTGALGLVYYYFNLYKKTDDSSYGEKAVGHLEKVFDSWNNNIGTLKGNAISNGAAGLAYVASLLQKAGLVEIDIHKDFKELDHYIFQSALHQISNDGDIDPLHGAVGVLSYFNSRKDEFLIRKYIEELVIALSNRVVESNLGSWFSNRLYQKEFQINFSLSHGLCGYLCILLDSYKAGICSPLIRDWVNRGIKLILHYYRQPNYEENRVQQFPAAILLGDKEVPVYNTRLAWCYGDLNQVLLLYKAGEILQNKKWIVLADMYGKETLKRNTPELAMVTDSHFCHGSAGVAFCYQKLYERTNVIEYKAAYNLWLMETLKFISIEIDSGFYTNKECNLLEGLPGINLSMLPELMS
ncbi:MAG: lanthionine synthetase LanC family protein [Chitinophagaceae bacterium]